MQYWYFECMDTSVPTSQKSSITKIQHENRDKHRQHSSAPHSADTLMYFNAYLYLFLRVGN